MKLETKFDMLYGWIDRLENKFFPIDEDAQIRCLTYIDELKRDGYRYEITDVDERHYDIKLIDPDDNEVHRLLNRWNRLI